MAKNWEKAGDCSRPGVWPLVCSVLAMLNLSQLLGKMLNFFGLPGFAKTGSYQAPVSGVSVRIQHTDLFTVISVDGVDVYLDRTNGDINGVGFNSAAPPTHAGFLELSNSGGLREALQAAASQGSQGHSSVTR
ncbi:MAG: hypothetical protein ABIR70_21350 [Bryobacteraceae bacterium]